MKKKTEETNFCYDCVHYEACQSWNIGILVSDSPRCANRITYDEFLKKFGKSDFNAHSNALERALELKRVLEECVEAAGHIGG